MSGQLRFNKGDDVFWVHGSNRDQISRHQISRTTSTMAFIVDGGREHRFRQNGGSELPRRDFYTSYIEHPNEKLVKQFRKAEARRRAGALSFAAQQFQRGDDEQLEKIVLIYEGVEGAHR